MRNLVRNPIALGRLQCLLRPTNENFNGLLRRYVGKGTDLGVYSQQDLDRISHRINTMPRRIHQWESALDRYSAGIVALTA